ncbi:Hypothetical predicted protein, partial [Olea europaea subsp. europaea]
MAPEDGKTSRISMSAPNKSQTERTTHTRAPPACRQRPPPHATPWATIATTTTY